MEYHIPKLPENAKCKRCRARGEIRLPSHNTIWCGGLLHFLLRAGRGKGHETVRDFQRS